MKHVWPSAGDESARGVRGSGIVVAAAVIGAWALAAGVARSRGGTVIALSDALVALALLVTYAGGCVLSIVLSRAPKRHALFRVVLLTAVLAISLALLETPAALGILDYRRVWDGITGNWRGPANEFQLDFERAFKRLPNVHIVGRPQGDIAGRYNLPIRSPRPLEFTFNAHGFRGRKDYASADVALIGDSFVEGWFVSDGETCADRLAAKISRPVANLGQSGYGLEQEQRVMEREALRLRPRWVVWFFYEGNDLYDDQQFENTMVYLARVREDPATVARGMGYDGVRFRDASFTLNAFAVLRRFVDPLVPNRMPYVGVFQDSARGPLHVYFYDEAVGAFGSFETERLRKAEQTLMEGKRLCDSRGVRLLVAYIPSKFRVYREYTQFEAASPCRSWQPWDLPQRFAALCRAEGIDMLDLTDVLQDQARAGRFLYVPQDSHWDRGAHELVAELLAARYRSLFS